MPDPTPHPTVRLSDPISLLLHAAKLRLRDARLLAEDLQDPVRHRALITTALDAVQDALDVRDQT